MHSTFKTNLLGDNLQPENCEETCADNNRKLIFHSGIMKHPLRSATPKLRQHLPIGGTTTMN